MDHPCFWRTSEVMVESAMVEWKTAASKRRERMAFMLMSEKPSIMMVNFEFYEPPGDMKRLEPIGQ